MLLNLIQSFYIQIVENIFLIYKILPKELMISVDNLKSEKFPQLESPQLKKDQEEEDSYFMGKNSNRITRFLSFQYFWVLGAYQTHYSKQKLMRVCPDYNKYMIGNEYLWYKFLSKGAYFNLYKQIFLAQKCPFITLIFLSILIAILALFGAYYQRFLFAQLLDSSFETSGWVFFGIICASAISRFFIFNYVQNLANMIAMNTRCHLQNALIRLFFHLPKNVQDGLLINNFFVSIQLVSNTIKLLPYFIISFFIVFGIVGFIIDIVGVIGLVVLGLTLLFLFIQVFILRYMLHLHEQYVQASDKRTSLTIFGTSILLRLTYNGLASVFLSLIKKYRKKQTEIDRKYNGMDGIIQILTQSITFITIFIFYLSSEYDDDNPTYHNILDAAILFSVFKTPIKMVGYGLSMCLQGYAGLHRLQHLYDLCQLSQPPQKQIIFPRFYPMESCFASSLVVEACFGQIQQITLKTDNILSKHKGELIMVLGKIDSNPTCDGYLQKLQNSLKETTYCKIDYHTLINDKNIRENILFGLPYDKQKYQMILDLVYLHEKLNRFPEGDLTRMDENYFKTIYLGLSLKIEIARALYSDVEVLIINRMIFKEFQNILVNIRDYRRKQNLTTVVINLSGSHYDIADWLIVLGRNTVEEGTYQQLIKKSSVLKQFQVEYLSHIDLVSDDKTSSNRLTKLQQAPLDKIDVNFCDIFGFYNLSHYGAGLVIIVVLLLPPLMDLYMQVVIAESVHVPDQAHSSFVGSDVAEQKHFVTLRFGISVLLFITFNIIKIIFFTLYLKLSGYRIVKKVISSFLLSKVQNTLDMSNRKSALDLQRNIEQIDTRITPDLDVGITIIFEQITALIFGIISSLLFLAIGLPFFIITIVIIIVMVAYNRKLLFIRRLARSRYNSFIKKLVLHRQDYLNFNRDQHIFEQFVEHNRRDIQADLNQEWLMQALGIILQILYVLLLIITIAVSLVQFQNIHSDNEAFLELAISFLIGLSNGARINLKIFRSIDKQLIGIASLNKTIEHHQINKTQEVRDFPDNRIFTVEFRDFSIRFKDDILHKLNFSFKAGQRIVITGSRTSGKRVAFYAALGIFEPEHVDGDIFMNRVPIYAERITRQSVADKLFILENQALTFLGDTVAQAIKTRAPRRVTEEIDYTLNEMWRVLNIEPLFTSQTPIKQLSAPYLDLFSLVRALMVRPQILVLEGGLSHIDTVNRRKITEWLIKHNEISIIIDLTNRIQVIQLYPRLLQFKDGQLVKDIRQ